MLADFLRKLGDAITSLVGVVPGVAATVITFAGKFVAAAADVVIGILNGVGELLDRVADYLNGAFSE